MATYTATVRDPEAVELLGQLAAAAGMTPQGWVCWQLETVLLARLIQNAPAALSRLVDESADAAAIAGTVARTRAMERRLHDGAPAEWKVAPAAPRPEPIE